MKSHSLLSGRFALTSVAAAALSLLSLPAWSLGLGSLTVQSALGESLRAEIDVTSLTAEEAANLNLRIAPPESYRAAGVDYNSVLASTRAVLQRRPNGQPYLRLTSDRAVQEPFVDVILEVSWTTGRLVREYTLLFDPPATARTPSAAASATAAAPAAPSTSPVIAAAPAEPVPLPPTPARPPERPRPVPSPARAPDAAAPVAPAPTPAPAPAAAPVRPPAVAASGADDYRVRPGDTLSRIAARTQRSGVSLDQMLVGLYRSNPQAFVDNNMNRLKSGVVLTVPSTDEAKAVQPAEARQLIQAQSADFGAYRQRLAGAAPTARTEGTSRQASGQVSSAVEDRKQAAAPSPDKLTLSKGAGAASAAQPEERISKDRERQEAATRVAELSKNVDELKKLSGAAATAAVAPASVPVPVPASAPFSVLVTPPPAAPVAAAPAPAASAAVPAASSAPARAAASAPKPPVAAAAPAEEPGFISSLIEDNPLLPALGAAAVALLAGFGIYRFLRHRKQVAAGETSFLESRLQPDSFFGASGGQRIDTRESGGTSSAMSYSLSQLDAIGDVDPVAEADVYLAYGRDLQAEEILKEAMRSTPERMAIRSKLLEVYAKRRDIKGFELLATQLFALTRGEGEDWAKAQELGSQIDPDNPLYTPGGMPQPVDDRGGRSVEPLGASTMPQSVLPTASGFGASMPAPLAPETDSHGLDLDLDLDLDAPTGAPHTAPGPLEATQAFAPHPPAEEAPMSLDFDLPDLDAPAPASATPRAAPPAPAPMEFDLSSISLDLDVPGSAPAPVPAATATPDLGDIDLPLLDEGELDNDDPLARKLELAEEFRQIGDMEGARDLVQEVLAKASGALRAKAEGMLADLG